MVAGVGQEDARPGSLASSWFVAAASVLAGAGASRLWERAVPDHEDQEWDYERPERYRCEAARSTQRPRNKHFLLQRRVQIQLLEVRFLAAGSCG